MDSKLTLEITSPENAANPIYVPPTLPPELVAFSPTFPPELTAYPPYLDYSKLTLEPKSPEKPASPLYVPLEKKSKSIIFFFCTTTK